MLSVVIPPHIATQRIPLVEELVYQRCVLPSPLVLRKAPLNALTLTPDMDQTVLRMKILIFLKGMDYIFTPFKGGRRVMPPLTRWGISILCKANTIMRNCLVSLYKSKSLQGLQYLIVLKSDVPGLLY